MDSLLIASVAVGLLLLVTPDRRKRERSRPSGGGGGPSEAGGVTSPTGNTDFEPGTKANPTPIAPRAHPTANPQT